MKYVNMNQRQRVVATKLKLSRLHDRGQVTISQELRDKFGLEPGDMVAFVAAEQGVLISPQELMAKDAFARTGTLLKVKGITLGELIESGREIRGELIEKEYGLPEKQW